MTIETLCPFLSCICSPSEVDSAIAQGFKELYILTTNGIIKHHQLRGENRFIRIKVDEIPGRSKPVLVTECLNFLPAGKVPFNLFQQVEAFFRKVIQLKGQALEAMIFIMWNPEQGYHLYVPNQSVAGASANFSLSDLPTGSIIVVDIHSHGAMSAFFSGTDDKDDSTTIRFSGVFGKLTVVDPVTKLPTPADTIWRFNYYTKKFATKIADIFEVESRPEIEVPQAWLDQVKVAAPTVYKGPPGCQVKGGKGHKYPRGGGKGVYQPQFADEDDLVQSNFNGFGFGSGDVDEDAMEAYYRTLGNARANYPNQHSQATPVVTTAPPGKVWRYDPNAPAIGIGGTPTPMLGEKALSSLVEDPSLEEEVGAYQLGKLQTPQGQSPNESVKNSLLSLTEEDETGAIEVYGDIYCDIAAVHGDAVADAWWDMDQAMAELNGKDELLNTLGCDMFELMSEEGQEIFFKDIYERLAPAAQRSIETNGF